MDFKKLFGFEPTPAAQTLIGLVERKLVEQKLDEFLGAFQTAAAAVREAQAEISQADRKVQLADLEWVASLVAAETAARDLLCSSRNIAERSGGFTIAMKAGRHEIS